MNVCFFAKCKISFYQMQKAIRDYLLTFAPEFNNFIGMNWIILLLAGLFEVSLTFCLGKTRAASGLAFYLWGSGFLASTVLSMTLLAKAVQTLPLGTAYAIWTGIGAVGTVLIGIFVFKEPASPIRLFFLFTLIASLIGLKIVSY